MERTRLKKNPFFIQRSHYITVKKTPRHAALACSRSTEQTNILATAVCDLTLHAGVFRREVWRVAQQRRPPFLWYRTARWNKGGTSCVKRLRERLCRSHMFLSLPPRFCLCGVSVFCISVNDISCVFGVSPATNLQTTAPPQVLRWENALWWSSVNDDRFLVGGNKGC